MKNPTWTMTFESEGLLIVAIYIWLQPASYVVFLTTLDINLRKTNVHEHLNLIYCMRICMSISNLVLVE